MIGGKALAPKALVAELSRPGPYPVLRGELALVGLPGVVFTPASGTALPAVAFGHDWLQPAARYLGLLRHLASWGIVAAAPDTQRGPVGSHRGLAHDLRTALGVCAGVRLGGSARGAAVSVDPHKLGVAGHGMGAGSAVLAAAVPAADTRVQAVGEPYWEVGHGVAIQAVATIAITDTRPSAVEAARAVHLPGMHLAYGRDLVSPPAAGAELLADAWAGESSLRTLKKATHLGLLEGRHWSDVLLDGKGEAATRTLTRALLTGFLLHRLGGDDRYAAAFDGAVKGTELRSA
ncbi:dienelactone hydrolase family protein [Actinomycetospora straminea]|uniref:Dienelactone hydrolase n=1 Tax=Actinomycetospora straminea TaxID=663607 RepID=A0ABP9E4X1_9PSEU|nr:alpha/beta hydrolase [Actinomycetospora straminea]MDD7931252.1 alpha/beta hydrolase [Actinomycetospora straminea]